MLEGLTVALIAVGCFWVGLVVGVRLEDHWRSREDPPED